MIHITSFLKSVTVTGYLLWYFYSYISEHEFLTEWRDNNEKCELSKKIIKLEKIVKLKCKWLEEVFWGLNVKFHFGLEKPKSEPKSPATFMFRKNVLEFNLRSQINLEEFP